MQLILHYLKRYKKLFVLNIISVFGFALVELGIPTIVSEMIDNGIMHQDKQYLIRMGIVIVVISLIGVSGTILLGYCCAKISTSVTRDIREDVFQKVQTFSHNEMNQFGIASLITRTNNDANKVEGPSCTTIFFPNSSMTASFIISRHHLGALALYIANTGLAK